MSGACCWDLLRFDHGIFGACACAEPGSYDPELELDWCL